MDAMFWAYVGGIVPSIIVCTNNIKDGSSRPFLEACAVIVWPVIAVAWVARCLK